MTFRPSKELAFQFESQTPVYLYSRSVLQAQAQKALSFRPQRLTVRYAIKANPHAETIKLFEGMGLHFDASSEREAQHCLKLGIPSSKVALNSQQLPSDLPGLVESGVFFTATSLHQLERFGEVKRGAELGVRLNPGMGSGATKRVTTGGVAAGFGIWHEYIPQVLETAQRFDLHITKVHTHIGAGTDPEKWKEVAALTLELARRFPEVRTVSLGGGFKVGRMPDEVSADLSDIGAHVEALLEAFEREVGHPVQLEIEPGTFLTADCGVLLSTVMDLTDTGSQGYNFMRLNTGMNDILRPTMYGALHPLHLYQRAENEAPLKPYVVIGHNCESGDILTPVKGNSEEIEPRSLPQATIGDLLAIGGAGAYCASMRAKGYNFFDEAQEVFVE